jgi:hypothetical protein
MPPPVLNFVLIYALNFLHNFCFILPLNVAKVNKSLGAGENFSMRFTGCWARGRIALPGARRSAFLKGRFSCGCFFKSFRRRLQTAGASDRIISVLAGGQGPPLAALAISHPFRKKMITHVVPALRRAHPSK